MRRALQEFLVPGATFVVLAIAFAWLAYQISPDWMFAKYPNLAHRLLSEPDLPTTISDASPLYLFFDLRVVPTTLRAIQTAAAAITIVPVYLLCWLGTRNRVISAIAALLLGASRYWLIYSAVLEPDLMIGVLNAAALAIFVWDNRTLRILKLLSAGAFVGLSSALRPTSTIVAVLMIAWVALGKTGISNQKQKLQAAAAVLAGFLICLGIGLASVRTNNLNKAPSLMTADQVVYQGHRPGSSDIGPSFPILLKLAEYEESFQPDHLPDYQHELYRRFALESEEDPTDDAQTFWMKKVFRYALRYPGALLSQLWRKELLAISLPDHDTDIAEVVFLLQSSKYPGLPLRIFLFAAVAGVIVSFRGNSVQQLLAAIFIGYQLISLLFFYQARYAVDFIPIVICLTAFALSSLWEARRRARSFVLRLAAFVPVLLVEASSLSLAAGRFDQREALVPAHSRATILANAGKRPAAHLAWVAEQAAFPDYQLPFSFSGLHLDADSPTTAMEVAKVAQEKYGSSSPADAFLLGVIYTKANRCDLALPLAELVANSNFHTAVEDITADGDLLAADCLRENPAEALRHVRLSLRRTPGSLSGLSRAIAIAAAHPELSNQANLKDWQEELSSFHDAPSARYALARQRRLWGDTAGALADATWLVEHVPEAYALGEFERALDLLDQGNIDDALAAYAKTLRLHVFLYESSRFDAPVRGYRMQHPNDATFASIALSHWIRQGDDAEIRDLMKQSSEGRLGVSVEMKQASE